MLGESKGRLALAAVAMALAVASACSEAQRDSAPKSGDFSSLRTRAPGEYLVTLAAGASLDEIVRIYGRFGIRSTHGLGRNVFLVKLDEDPGPARMEELRGESAHIKAVQPNFIYRANAPGKFQ
jgi:hypothetical protein